MSNFLLIPIRVDALFVQTGQPVVQALADFRFLPWVDETAPDTDFRNKGAKQTKARDINGDVAYISENFVAQPFSDTNLMLPAGLHLHWALPDALVTGRHPRDSEGVPAPASLQYPAIPNRWLVVRDDGVKWVVESDYLYPAGTTPVQSMQPATWPLATLANDAPPNVQPFRFIGRCIKLNGAYAEDNGTGPAPDFLYKHAETLTAFGYGEPGWHAFYPDCHSVLGLHDDGVTAPPPSTAAYQVFGWYGIRPDDTNRLAADVFKTFVDDFNSGKLLGKASLDALVRKTLNYADATPAALSADDYKTAFLWHLDHEFRWQLDASQIPLDSNTHQVLLDGLVCYGSVQFSGRRDDDVVADDISVVVGNTGTEALSAYLATRQAQAINDLAKQEQYENQLESLTLAPKLQGQAIDLGPKFLEARHEKSFTAVNGGVLWKLRPPQATHPDTTTAPVSAVHLPADLRDAVSDAGLAAGEALAAAVAAANRLQSAYERGQQTIRALRRRIFADWYKYMICCYRPADTEETDYPDIDDVRRFIEMEVAELYLLEAFTGELITTTDKATGAFKQASSTWWSSKKPLHLDLLRPESFRFLGDEFASRLERIAPLQDGTAAIHRRLYFQRDFVNWLTTEFKTRCAADSVGDLTLPDEVLTVFRPLYDKDDPAVVTRYGSATARPFQSLADLLAGSLNSLSDLVGRVGVIAQAAAKTTRDLAGINAALSDATLSAAITALVPDTRWTNAKKAILAAPPATAELQAAFARAIAAAFPAWALQTGVAPRFWQPNEPVLLLAGGTAVQASDRNGADGKLLCAVQTSDVRTADDAAIKQLATLDTLSITPDADADDPQPAAATPFAPRTTGGNPWHALYLEWEVGVLPVKEQSNVLPERRRYGPYFVRDNYSFGGTGIEFMRREDEALPTSSSTLVTGRSVITPHAVTGVNAAIQNYLADITRQYFQRAAAELTKDEQNLLAKNIVTALVAYYSANKAAIRDWATGPSTTLHDKGIPLQDIVRPAYDALPKEHIQAQSVTGFNAALLMQRQSLQLPVSDPLAFREYRDFTEKVVRDAVADQNHTAPEPLFDFVPIRAGDLRFERLRLVDSFGRTLDLDAEKITQTSQMKSYLPQWAAMPPRITQPARLNFRFLAADGSFVESNSHPLTSPVCGWLIANNLDGSLMVYDTQGFALGYVDEEGAWRPPPGRRGPVLVEDIANPHLSRAVKWVCTSAQKSGDAAKFMQDFLDAFEAALDNIAPDNSAQHQARVLLMSRPVALVRTAIDLQVQGAYAEHLGWESFRRRLLGHPPKRDNYSDVQFPIRIGDYSQFNDGVVGYWIEDGDDYVERYVLTDDSLGQLNMAGELTDEQLADLGKVKGRESFGQRHFEILLSETLGAEEARLHGPSIIAAAARCRPFFAPQSLFSRRTDATKRAGEKQLEADAPADNIEMFDPDKLPVSINFHQSLAEPVRVASILMDPRALVHCHTGVLPAKALSIPPEHYLEPLRRIQVTFLTAPILTDPRAALVPLPSEPGFSWSWVQKDGPNWTQLDATPVVFQADILATYPDDGAQVWQELLSKNWLQAVPGKSDRATLVVRKERAQEKIDPSWKTPALDEPAKEKWLGDLQRTLDLCARGLRPTHEEARFGPAQELREGWLTLTPDS